MESIINRYISSAAREYCDVELFISLIKTATEDRDDAIITLSSNLEGYVTEGTEKMVAKSMISDYLSSLPNNTPGFEMSNFSSDGKLKTAVTMEQDPEEDEDDRYMVNDITSKFQSIKQLIHIKFRNH